MSPKDRVLMDIKKELEPISVIYEDRPVLRRGASLSLLRNCPMRRIQQMCRDLNTNIDGLMDCLKDAKVI